MEQVRKETLQAYSDCNDLVGGERNLKFRAGVFLTPQEWQDLMSDATPYGYNDFDPERVGKFLSRFDIRIEPAREGSVACYISGDSDDLEIICLSRIADELNIRNGTLRLWWD